MGKLLVRTATGIGSLALKAGWLLTKTTVYHAPKAVIHGVGSMLALQDEIPCPWCHAPVNLRVAPRTCGRCHATTPRRAFAPCHCGAVPATTTCPTCGCDVIRPGYAFTRDRDDRGRA